MRNSLLGNQFGKHGMENGTRKRSYMSIMVFTWGSCTGRARRTKELAGRLQKDVLALLVSHRQQKISGDVAVLNSLMHIPLSLHIVFRPFIARHRRSMLNT